MDKYLPPSGLTPEGLTWIFYNFMGVHFPGRVVPIVHTLKDDNDKLVIVLCTSEASLDVVYNLHTVLPDGRTFEGIPIKVRFNDCFAHDSAYVRKFIEEIVPTLDSNNGVVT